MRRTTPTHLLVAFVIAFTGVLSGCQETSLPMPPLQATGWINGAPPAEEELVGKVVVLDFFATWCGPCRESTPELMELYLKYGDQGVQFVGLTFEDSSQVELIQSYVDNLGIRWPVGYHAVEPTNSLVVESLPTVIIFDPQGQLVHREVGFVAGSTSIEDAIKAALKKKP